MSQAAHLGCSMSISFQTTQSTSISLKIKTENKILFHSLNDGL